MMRLFGYSLVLALHLCFVNFGHTQFTDNVYCDVTYSSGSTGPNRGLEYIYYDTIPYVNPTAPAGTPEAQRYPAYDPRYVINLTSIYVGQTTYLGFPTNTQFTTPARFYPNGPLHTIVNSTLVHRGYLYARTSGLYTFTVSYVDDIVLTWLGAFATNNDFSKANANNKFTYVQGTQTPVSFTINLTQGQYVPLRIQYSNSQEAAGFQMSITNPAGTVLLDRTRSVDVVSRVCDDATATFPDLNQGTPNCTVNTASGTRSNAGLQYGIWNATTRNTGPDNIDTGFSAYPVGAFDNTAAVYTGVTNRVGINVAAGPGDTGSVVPIYDDTTLRFYSNFITVIHRGYLYARASGVYTFSTSGIQDDILLLWVGPNAVSGYTRANANLVSVAATNVQTKTFSTYVNAGQYLPIRIQYDNAQGTARLVVTATDPSGNTILSATGLTDFYFEACPGETSNGSPIPQFSRWFTNSTSFNTVTSSVVGATATTTTTITRPSGTNPGTIVVLAPASFVTVTGPNTISGAPDGTYTSTIADPSGGTPGTVQVFIPAVYATVTSIYSGESTDTSTIAQPTDTAPGTVVLLIPSSYVTSAAIYTPTGTDNGPSTSTLATQSGTVPGTVVVYTAMSTSTFTSVTRPATISTDFASNMCICTPVPF